MIEEKRQTCRGALDVGLVREREVRLGHADRESSEALAGVARDLGLGLLRVRDVLGAVELGRDGRDLVLDREVEVVAVRAVRARGQRRGLASCEGTRRTGT